jgi:hypothetical protein
MTDLEFDIMDELYFTIDFQELKKNLSMDEAKLKNALYALIQKGWVKCLEQETDREMEVHTNFQSEYQKYNYLATKAGLLAHNSK